MPLPHGWIGRAVYLCRDGECDPNQKQNSGCRMNEVCLDNGKCQYAPKYVLFNQSCPSPDSQMCG